MTPRPLHPARLALLALLALGCHSTPSTTDGGRPEVVEGVCVADAGTGDAGVVDHLRSIGCTSDFSALASEPIDSTLPGARSVKVVLDTAQDNAIYFQNSVIYQIHYQFASTHLSGHTLPIVPSLSEFNTTEYFSPDRRFILGAVTYYDGPKAWALELSPYDTASAEMIQSLYQAVQAKTFFGNALAFHPTSEAIRTLSTKLPSTVSVVTTDELYSGIEYQPLSLGSAIGQLHFVTSAEIDTADLSYQDLVVLDQAPNDISVVQGMITETFQTPLSHLNVLARNRKTPNMGLKNAMTNEILRAFEGKLVELTVTAERWSIREATKAEAEASWAAHMPAPVTLPAMNLSVTELLDIEDVTPDPTDGGSLRDAIKDAVLAFGGKAAQYSVLARTANVPIKKAFGIPLYYYDQFMKQNGFYDRVDALLADSSFTTEATVRKTALAALRADMVNAPMDEGFQTLLKAKLAEAFPGEAKVRFRTSTNSEDLDGFPCAGCYESHTGHTDDWNDVLLAISRPSAAPGCSAHSRSAATTGSTTSRWAWRCSSTRTSPTRRPTGWRSPPTPSTPRASTPPSTSTCSTAETTRWSTPPPASPATRCSTTTPSQTSQWCTSLAPTSFHRPRPSSAGASSSNSARRSPRSTSASPPPTALRVANLDGMRWTSSSSSTTLQIQRSLPRCISNRPGRTRR